MASVYLSALGDYVCVCVCVGDLSMHACSCSCSVHVDMDVTDFLLFNFLRTLYTASPSYPQNIKLIRFIQT